jgi:DNA helicase HerA-like ATPase
MNIHVGELLQLYGDPQQKIDGTKHAAMFGATGAGKSTLLFNSALQYIRNGWGLAMVDPNGDLIDKFLHFIPKKRANDVILIDPTAEYVPGLNPLHGDNLDLRLEHLISILAQFYGSSSWLAQSDYISRNVGRAVIRIVESPTALHVSRALNDSEYRKELAERSTDPSIQQFFRRYDEEWDKRQREQASAPPINKFDVLLKPYLKEVIGQRKGLDIGKAMDDGKIILCRFSKGRLGADTAAFLGSIFTNMVLFAALARDGRRFHERKPFALLIDEFHNFTRGNSHEYLLSETRKYGVALTIADQTIDQLPEGSEASIFGNVSSLIVGRVGARDADRLSKELGLPEPKTLLNLPPYYWYKKTFQGTHYFKGLPSLPKRGDEANRDKMIRRNLPMYGTKRTDVERDLNNFLLNVS